MKIKYIKENNKLKKHMIKMDKLIIPFDIPMIGGSGGFGFGCCVIIFSSHLD